MALPKDTALRRTNDRCRDPKRWTAPAQPSEILVVFSRTPEMLLEILGMDEIRFAPHKTIPL